ncbi:MAG: iron transporter [Spirochaetota bacterium]
MLIRTSQNITHDYSTTTENKESDKLVMGHETTSLGIEFYFGGVLIYEGGRKDTVYPFIGDLEAGETVVHLEARANWSKRSELPPGAVSAGFVAYLDITATIKNQVSGHQTEVDLSPHINLENNFHYSRNTPLPGSDTDLYTVTFSIHSPIGKSFVLVEEDWKQRYGLHLLENTVFHYRDVTFAQVASDS